MDSWWSTLVTALSLQLAAFANHSTITLYHAILVTWLSLPALIMSFSFYGLYHRTEDPPLSLVFLTAAHVISFLSFTTWVWATAPTFQCADSVHLVVFGHWVKVVGWIRYIVLAVLGFWNVGAVLAFGLAIPYAFTEVPFLVEVSPSLRALAIYSANYGDDVPVMERVLIGAFTGFGFLLFSIIMAELMIATHAVVQQDGQWGFGQVAAMILLLTPVFNLVRVVRDYRIKQSTMRYSAASRK